MRIAVATVKGGVGKTTTAINLGAALAEAGFRILLVDMDQQANLSSVFADDALELKLTVANLLVDTDIPTAEAIRTTKFTNLDLLPSNLELSRLDIQLAGDSEAQYYLGEKLDEVADRYDYVIIDCPPSLGLQTTSALVASEGVIIPVECQEWAARGSTYIIEVMAKVRRRANPALRLLGYLINRYDARRKVEESYRAELYERFPGQVFETVIRNSVRYPEAVTVRQPITAYRPSSEQADHFRQLAREVVAGGPSAKHEHVQAGSL
jgi:chromosome partitioning protein